MNYESVVIAVIDVGERMRRLDEAKVETLAQSMEVVGQLSPIICYSPDDETMDLVAGAHRLAAAKRLGWKAIDAYIMDGDELHAQLAEIAENLHRAELTAIERSEQIAQWIRLTEERQVQLRQVDADKKSSKRNDGRGHRKEGGRRAAAREINVSEPQARRAQKIASISPHAKQAAADAGLDDNQSALLRVASKAPEEQVTEVGAIARERERPAPKRRRKPLGSALFAAGVELRKAVKRIDRLSNDPRRSHNKDALASLERGELRLAEEMLREARGRIRSLVGGEGHGFEDLA